MNVFNSIRLGLFAFATTVAAQSAFAAPIVIDYENIAPAADITSESGTRLFSNGTFQVSSHGHIVDSVWATNNGFANNGSDYYIHDNGAAFQIDTTDGSLFSLSSFDATRYHPSFGNFGISVTGTFGAGGTITSSFVVTSSSFSTFLLGSGWVGLTSVSFSAPSGTGAFDNIVLNAASSSVPAPGALALLGLGLLGIAGLRRRKVA